MLIHTGAKIFFKKMKFKNMRRVLLSSFGTCCRCSFLPTLTSIFALLDRTNRACPLFFVPLLQVGGLAGRRSILPVPPPRPAGQRPRKKMVHLLCPLLALPQIITAPHVKAH